MIEHYTWEEVEETLRQEAAESRPEECCGLISADEEGGFTVFPLTNRAEHPRHAFRLGEEDQLDVLREIDARGDQLHALYHSHPSGNAYPSEGDLDVAKSWPGLTWVIVGIPEGAPATFWSGVLA